MRVENLYLGPSPVDPGLTRASIEVDYRGRRAGRETWWVDVPGRVQRELTHAGDPWLAALLPLAFVLQQPLELRLPVDPQLLENADQILNIWARWYPRFGPIPLLAETGEPASSLDSGNVAAFFSAGIDSIHTVLHHDRIEPNPIDELIFIRGFDLRLRNQGGLREAQERVQSSATVLGKDLMVVTTNLRQTRLQEVDWLRLAHGPMLAAIGLLLGPRYQRLWIPSTKPLDLAEPFGSHPGVDPLFSTTQTVIDQYGASFTRTEKVAYLRQHPGELQHLRVCWEGESGANCGRCSKCLRTMTALEIFGLLEGCAAFPTRELDLDVLSKLYFPQQHRYVGYMEELMATADQLGRTDISHSIQAALSRSKWMYRWLGLGLIRWAQDRWRLQPRLRRLTRNIRPIVRKLARRIVRVLP